MSIDSNSSDPERDSIESTRRHFLTVAAIGAAAGSLPAIAICEPFTSLKGAEVTATGAASPLLVKYDELMTGFMRDQKPPGAALAVTHGGRLVYARGFGYADVEKKQFVQAASLFRIASISKPITAVAVFQLIEKGKLKLDDKVFSIVKLKPPAVQADPRLADVTVLHCLQHTAGWDRSKGFDPMSPGAAEDTARGLGIDLPIRPEHIIRYTLGKSLNFDPGTAHAYSNFGYCVLGRVIEAASGMSYGAYVTKHVLNPLGINRMRLAKNLLRDRAPDEVKYYDMKGRTGRAISGPQIGNQVPVPYGFECLQTMDAAGGWIASAVDLMRFGVAFDDPSKCSLLSKESIEVMFARPDGAPGLDEKGKPKTSYYACGWVVRPNDGQSGRFAKWHRGELAGTQTMFVCRGDGTNWAVLFNGDCSPDGKQFAESIDPLLHRPADEVKDWPNGDLFAQFKGSKS